jgi:hypothetical protein
MSNVIRQPLHFYLCELFEGDQADNTELRSILNTRKTAAGGSWQKKKAAKVFA